MAQADTITDGDNNATSSADAICTCYTFDVRFFPIMMRQRPCLYSVQYLQTVLLVCGTNDIVSHRSMRRRALRPLTSASVTMGVDWEGEVEMAGAVRAMEPRSTSGDLSAFLRISMPCWISSGVSELARRSVGGRSASLFTETWPARVC